MARAASVLTTDVCLAGDAKERTSCLATEAATSSADAEPAVSIDASAASPPPTCSTLRKAAWSKRALCDGAGDNDGPSGPLAGCASVRERSKQRVAQPVSTARHALPAHNTLFGALDAAHGART